MASLYAPGSVVTVRAILLGERIDLKGLELTQRLAVNPLLISAGEGQYAALFRYGAVVLFGVSPLQEVTFVDQLARLVWYIVILIVIEIVLTLYQLLFLGRH
jgi:uncharacterized Rmd1/YagE family protein